MAKFWSIWGKRNRMEGNHLILSDSEKMKIAHLKEKQQHHINQAHKAETDIFKIERSAKTTFRRMKKGHDYLRTRFSWYQSWHVRPVATAVHLLALLFVISIMSIEASLGLFALTKEQPDRQALAFDQAISIEAKHVIQVSSNAPVSFSTENFPEFNLKTGTMVVSSQTGSVQGKLAIGESEIRAKVLALDGSSPVLATIEANSGSDSYSIRTDGSNLKPGRYRLNTVVKTASYAKAITQDFTWGVLAINFNQSSYRAGEEAKIGMAVLDDRGKTDCKAKVSLTIYDPNNRPEYLSTFDQTIAVSDVCGNATVTNLPDYSATFVPKMEGKYSAHLVALNKNGLREMDQSFNVTSSADFVVERENTAMRIYPPENYQSNIKVIANEAVNGKIVEKVPASFEISSVSETGTIEKSGDLKLISWSINLSSGDQIKLSYTYKAPNISPEFYLLGPLTVEQNDKIIFTEPRPWQIASDNNCSSAGTGNWNTNGTWGSCGGVFPVAGDTVTINSGHVITVPSGVTAAADTVTINNSGAATGITLTDNTSYLNINTGTGSISMTAPSSNGTSTIAVGAGTVNAKTISLSAGNSSKIDQITISTGTVETTGDISIAGGTITNSKIVFSGAGNLNVGGSLGTGGTFTASTGTVTLKATSGTPTFGAYAYYNLTENAGAAITYASAGNFTVGGTLTITQGYFSIGAHTLTVTGATSVTGKLMTTSATGAKIFNGGVTVNANGIWDFSGGNAATTFGSASGITNNGTTFNNGTGTATFNASQSLTGNTAMTFGGAVTVNAGFNLTNNILNSQTVTITGNLTQSGATGTFTTSDSTDTIFKGGVFTAGGNLVPAATANTIEYNQNGAQAIKVPTTNNYWHLKIGGTSGAKTPGGGITVNGNFTIGNAGTFTAGAYTHNFLGNWTVDTSAGTPMTATGSTINFNIPGVAAATSITGTSTATLAFITVNVNNTSGFSITTAGNPTKTPISASGVFTVGAGVTLTNNGTVTLTNSLAGTGGFTNEATGTLNDNFTGAMGISTLTASASGNTVTYGFAGAQTVKAVTYHHLTIQSSGAKTLTSLTTVNGTFTVGGTCTATTTDPMVVGALTTSGGTLTTGNTLAVTNNLTITTGGISIGAFSFSVGGTSTIAKNITFSNIASASTFTNDVTLNTGAVWAESAAAPITFGGSLANAATTWTSSTGVHKFTGSGKTISGATTITMPNTTIDTGASVTNSATNVTISTTLASGGAGSSWTNGNGSTGLLNFGGTSIGVATFTASATSNTVNYTYNAASPSPVTMNATTYYNLGAGTTSDTNPASTFNLGGDTTVNGTLTVGVSGSTNIDILGGGSYTLTLANTANVATPFSLSSKGTLSAGTGTVSYTGTGVATTTMATTTYYNLNVGTVADSNSVTFNFGGNPTISNILTIGASSGSGIHSMDGTTRTITLSMSTTGSPFVVNSSGAYTLSTSTIAYTGNAASPPTITILPITYYTLSVGTISDTNPGSTYNLGGDTTVNNILNLGNNASTNIDILGGGSYTLTFANTTNTGTPFSISSTGKGSLSPGTGTVSYPGTGVATTTMAATTYYNLNAGTVADSNSVTFSLAHNGSTTINNILTAGANSGAGIHTLFGDNDTLTLAMSTTGTPFVINSSGAFTASTSTVNYTGNAASAPTIAIAPITYYNLGVGTTSDTNPAVTYNLSGTTTVNAILTVGNAGSSNPDVLDGGSYTLEIAGTGQSPFSIPKGTFNYGTSTVHYSGKYSGGTTIILSISYYNLEFGGSLATSYSNNVAITIYGSLTVDTNGTYSPGNDVTVYKDIIGDGIITAGVTVTQYVSGTQVFGTSSGTNNWSFYRLIFTSASGSQIINTNSGTGTVTVTDTMTISASTTLNAADRTWIISKTGTPFVKTGSLGSQTSTFKFSGGNGATTIAVADYYNLSIFPSGATATHTFATGSYTIGGTLSIGGNSAPAGAAVVATNATLTINGGITMCAATCANNITFTKPSAAITWSPAGTVSWADNDSTTVEVGAVSLTGGTSTPKVQLATSVKASSFSIAASHELDLNGSNTLTLKNNGTPFSVSGTFTPSTGTIEYAPAANTGVTVASITYHHLYLNKTLNTFYLAGPVVTDDSGDITIYGWLDVVAGQDYPITVGGNWENHGNQFYGRNGTVTFNKASGTQTVFNNNAEFSNVLHSGNGTLQETTSDFLVAGSFSQTAGTFDPNGLNAYFAGNVSFSNGTNFLKSGTLSFYGTSQTFTDQTAAPGLDLGVVSVGITSYPSNLTTNSQMHVTSLTINSEVGSALNISDDTLTISGTGTPFVKNNTFTITNSTVVYDGSGSDTNITTVPYNNLTLSPSSSTNYIMSSDLTGANAVAGNLTIGSNANLDNTIANQYNLEVKGNWLNSGTFTSNSGGMVTLSGSVAQSVTSGASSFYNLTAANSAGPTNGITFTDSSTIAATFTDTTANSKLIFTDGATYNMNIIDINGSGAGDITMTTVGSGHGHWHFIVPGTPAVTYVTVDHSDATGSGAQINATSNCHDGNNNTYWNFGGGVAPVNDSLTFSNPYSSNIAVADDTTSWQFQAKVTDSDGPTDINYIEIRFANSADSSMPYDSLKYRYTRGTDTFSEEADTQNAGTITSVAGDATSSVNQWTVNFKIKLNNSFLDKDTSYNIELYSVDNTALNDDDDYSNIYQVKVLSISLGVDSPTLAFGGLLPGSVITGTTQTSVTTNYPNGYSLSIEDDVAGSDSVLLHTDLSTRIADYVGTIGTPTLWSGTGLGICVYSATNKDTSKWGSGTTEADSNNKYAGVPENAAIITSKTGSPTSSDSSDVGYKLVVPNNQKTGDYSGIITYTATGVLN